MSLALLSRDEQDVKRPEENHFYFQVDIGLELEKFQNTSGNSLSLRLFGRLTKISGWNISGWRLDFSHN